jgi:hypothetical protein
MTWKRGWPGLGLVVLILAVGLATRRPAQALSCLGSLASLQIESVTVAGAPVSTAAYTGPDPLDGPQVTVFGAPGGVRLTIGTFHGGYEEIYRGQVDAGP